MRDRIARLGAVALAAALVLPTLGTQSLWLDEVMGLDVARASWGEVVRFFRFLPEQHPLYYLLLRGWLVLGDSEVALRSLSALCFVASVPVMAALGTALAGRRAGTVVAWLAATSPFLLYFGQEARMYSLVALLSAASSLSLVRWLAGAERRWMGWYVLVGILGCYTHFFFTFLIAAHLGAVVLTRGWRSPAVRQLFLAQAAVAVAYLPWAALLLTHPPYGQPWKSSANIVFGLPYTLLRFTVGYAVLPANYEWKQHVLELARRDWLPIVLAALGFGATVLAGARRLWREGEPGRVTLIAGLAPAALALAGSFITILVGERYLIVSYPFFLVVVASGLTALLRPGARAAPGAGAVLAVAAATALSLWKYFASPEYGKEQWAEAAAIVREGRRPGDAVVLHAGFIESTFNYYYRPDSGAVVLRNSDPRALPAGYPRLWLVVSHAADEAAYLATVRREWRVGMERHLTMESGIRILRLERAAPDPARRE